MTETYRELKAHELAALTAFAEAHAKQANRARGCASWKDQLSMIYWYNARIWRGPDPDTGSTLHAIRNEFGPAWLYNIFKLPKAKQS